MKYTGVGTKGVGQVYDGPQFKKWDDWEKGEELEGTYIGRTEKADKYGKHGYVVKDKNNTEHSLNYTGLLAKKMVYVEEGQEILVRYSGKNKISKGKWAGSLAHNIEVFVAGASEGVSEDDGDDL